MEIKEKIKYYRKQAKISQELLAERCGWTSQTRISNYEKGIRVPVLSDLRKIAAALGYPLTVFVDENVEAGPDFKGKVPLISWVQAGRWEEIVDNFQPGDAEDWLQCPVGHSPATFVLRVRGDSMFNPHGRHSFANGDLIFVDPDRTAENGSLVVIRLDDSKEATFKMLMIEEGRKYIKPLNPDWPDKIMEINEDASICGVVIFQGKKI
ncbi:LexA family protein [Methylobacillus rhizosphaerae]|nr:XRE family transcriptional regulator [Methylobacillus rhizosphaerae]